MHFFVLSSTKPEFNFHFNDSYGFLHIRRIKPSTRNEFKQNPSGILSSLQLTYEQAYSVYDNNEDRFVDERKQISHIIISVDPYQNEPVFDIDLKITNEKFTIGINPKQNLFTTLKIRLAETSILDEEFELTFDVISHNMNMQTV